MGVLASNRFESLLSGKVECVCVSRPVVSDSATKWTVADQAPLSMELNSCNYFMGSNIWTCFEINNIVLLVSTMLPPNNLEKK